MSTPQNPSQHDNLLSYMRGWRTGAGGRSFTDQQMDNAWFKAGWEDGRLAISKVYRDASERIGSELSIVRAEDIQ